MRCYSYHLKQSIQKWPRHPRTSNWVKPVGSGLCRSQRRPKVLLSPWGSPVLRTGQATHRRIWVKAHAHLHSENISRCSKKKGEGRETPSSWPLARPSQRVRPIPTAHSNPDDRLSDLGFSVRTLGRRSGVAPRGARPEVWPRCVEERLLFDTVFSSL